MYYKSHIPNKSNHKWLEHWKFKYWQAKVTASSLFVRYRSSSNFLSNFSLQKKTFGIKLLLHLIYFWLKLLLETWKLALYGAASQLMVFDAGDLIFSCFPKISYLGASVFKTVFRMFYTHCLFRGLDVTRKLHLVCNNPGESSTYVLHTCLLLYEILLLQRKILRIAGRNGLQRRGQALHRRTSSKFKCLVVDFQPVNASYLVHGKNSTR